MNAVESTNLTKMYKHHAAVDSISLAVPAGVTCGFLGKNGAGKTTTIKMLTGLKRPTSGSFSILGEEISYGRENLTVGYLPDVPNFYPYMNATEFLNLCGKLCGIPNEKRKERIAHLLKQVGLEGVKTRIGGYSRGMKQRLGIAQALIHNPSVIFMDEPISALDPSGRRDVMEIISALKEQTVIFSTHILADVEGACDYILIIDQGKLLMSAYLADLYQQFSKNQAQALFFTDEQAQKVSASLQSLENLHVAQTDSRTLIVSSDAMEPAAISQHVLAHVGQMGIPLQHFAVHKPTLDEIFHEIVSKGEVPHA